MSRPRRPSSHSSRSDCRRGPRHGFSLPELIIAIVLLTVGLLALATTAAFLTREHAASVRAERAASIAGSRLERLRAAGCVSASGVETVDSMHIAWSVSPSGRSALAIVSISWQERATPVRHSYESGFPC
jgi:prepilin-type N-terminal cleavage/methylation domain-containing protein